MAIRDENTGTTEHLRDSRHHRGALMAGANTQQLAPPVKQLEIDLRQKRDTREGMEDVRVEKQAALIRIDVELDDVVRQSELELYALVMKNRGDARYLLCFRDGLSAVVSLRGEEEARAVEMLVKNLAQVAPQIHQRYHQQLTQLAGASVLAEKEWRQAETEAATAMTVEIIARRELVRQLQKNEGALQAIFPGNKRLVRSFFRQARKAKGGGEGGGGEG